MGRKPTVNTNLPKGMRARRRGDNTYYYYDTGAKPRKEIPLGKDYVKAIQKWSKLEIAKIPDYGRPTFAMVALRYENEVIPEKAEKTQVSYRQSLARLREFFVGDNPAPLDEIEPEHIRQYYQWRSHVKPSANLEMTIFKHIWKMAGPAHWGYTEKPCPANDIEGFKRKRREVYVEDYILDILYDIADQDTKDILDVAYLLGQRPSDTLKIRLEHIKDGILTIRQKKTKAYVQFEVTGKLKEIIDRRMATAKRFLFCNTLGNELTVTTFWAHFNKIRKQAIKLHPDLEEELKIVQFQDLRAKSGTDTFLKGSVEDAQLRLGHTTPNTTRIYIRKGKVMKPLK